MQLEVGKIIEGKITGVTNFGAFVKIEDGITGLVHISEVANEYVNDIKEYLAGKTNVRVKVLSIDGNGKVSLSIKQAEPPVKKTFKPAEVDFSSHKNTDMSFEDKLNKFKSDSDERMHDLKRSLESKRGSSYKKSYGSF